MECKRCLLTTDIPDLTLNAEGICNFCDLHDQIEAESAQFDFRTFIAKLQKSKNKYHCLIGISGGFDSSLMLHRAVKTWKLNPLVIHFDNGYNDPRAEANMMNLVKELGVDFIRYHLNQAEYDDICRSFLLAGVSDADIPNDMAMAALMYRAADQYGIKWIFNGHNYRTEGTSPLSWSYMDSRYIESVAYHYGGGTKTFPLLTFWKQLYYALIGIRNIRPFYYVETDPFRDKMILAHLYDWQDYGGKHAENIYTLFVGAFLLPRKFGIDKRILYLSAEVRSGTITKEEARAKLQELPKFDDFSSINERLGMDASVVVRDFRTHEDFDTYHSKFKKWKIVFWVLMHLRVFPRTFYQKYCR
jgi:tRNA(Ile)-lysidine synthase TilS/MesJ